MWRNETELQHLANLIGKDNDKVRTYLRLAKTQPQLMPQLLRLMQALGKRYGLDLADLPAFGHDSKIGNLGIHLGTQMLGHEQKGELWISLEELLGSHLLVSALTGWGKTTLLKYLLKQLMQVGHRVIVLDSESEYGDLAQEMGPNRCLYIPSEFDKDNCLAPPPGVELKRWLAAWKRSVREVLWCRDGMMNLLTTSLSNLHRNLRTETTNIHPTVTDLVRFLKQMKFRTGTRRAGYHESLLDRAISLQENLGPMLDCRRGFPMEELILKSIVYDVSSLSQEARLFVLHLKLLKLTMYREFLFERDGNSPQNGTDFVLVEEAHRSVAKVLEKRPDLGEPLVYDLIRSGRKRGIRFCFIEQVLAGLPHQLTGNIGNRIVGRLTDGRSLWTLSQITGWSDDKIDAVRKLPPRYFVLQTALRTEGIVFQVPGLSQNTKRLRGSEYREKIQAELANLRWESQESSTTWNEFMNTNSDAEQDKQSEPKIKDIHKKLLLNIAKNPFYSISEHAENIGNVGPWSMRRCCEDLTKLSFLEPPITLSLGKPGNPRKYLRISEEGADHLGINFKDHRPPGRGDFEHTLYQNIICDYLKKHGRSGLIEKDFNGKAIDVLEFGKDGKIIAYEIELRPIEHIVINITKDLAAGCVYVVVVVRNRVEQKKITSLVGGKLPAETLSKVKFNSIGDFVS